MANKLSVFLIFALSCFRLLRFTDSKLPQEEGISIVGKMCGLLMRVDVLQQIVSTMGSTYWEFNSDTCKVERVGITVEPPATSEHDIACECHYENNTVCHVVKIALKGYSLPGMLPPQISKLPYLREIDFAYNYLNGLIPHEWASMQLTSISVLANRLSGEIPKELGNITSLVYLNLEANQFSGAVPGELGKLINLQSLLLSSNFLTGDLPISFLKLRNLTDLRVNDNNFNGTIPSFIRNWKQLNRLEMHASGLKGPIPSAISSLSNLLELRISDITGPDQAFPVLQNMTGLTRLILRSCNIVGEIPAYIWEMKNLELLDLSFNKLIGDIASFTRGGRMRFLFLTNNMLNGDIPDSILNDGNNVDLSYNNFTWQGPQRRACQENTNFNLNLFRASSVKNNFLKGVLPCIEDFKCPRYSNCLHVNCGGPDKTVYERKENVLYEGDGEIEGGAAKYYRKQDSHWGFSSTGDFMDDFDYQNRRYSVSLPSSNMSALYDTARKSPISLAYLHYCLENGKYTVSLNFAEIQFTKDRTFSSLGRRLFDIYIQERLAWRDFNIEDEAKGSQKPVAKRFNVNVTNNYLEVRFYWAGKGTTRIPNRGVYGPLVSAISVVSDSKPCSHGGRSKVIVYVSLGLIALCIIIFILGVLWWKGCFPGKCGRRKDAKGGQDLPTGTFTLKQIKAATNDFDTANKIGEGGFGPVYKGVLLDDRVIAVKQLSSHSRQGNREFLNEIGMISCFQHPNLVKLHGFCVEGEELLVVYEYMENNSLARALFGPEHQRLNLDWPTRLNICLGIARGLAFLHEESVLKIVHRDIKATNVLLDKDLNPKISDFGLARLNEDEKTHISTRIAGTIGYMAPEYALWGYLTFKADVYSFGIVALETMSGKNNNSFVPSENYVCLLDWACHMDKAGNLIELVDEKLRPDVKTEDAETVLKVALLCTNATPSVRPTMSEVVSMLEGKTDIPDIIPESSSYTEDLRFKAMRDLRRDKENQSSVGSRTNPSTVHTFYSSSCDSGDIHPASVS